jgi:polysaccharide biosynthesis protein PslH
MVTSLRRALFITPWAPTGQGSGAQVVSGQLLGLMAQHCRVDVIHGVGGGFLGELSEQAGVIEVIARVPVRLQFSRHRIYSAAVAALSWPRGRSLRAAKMVTRGMRRAVRTALGTADYDLVHLDMGVMGHLLDRSPDCPVLTSAQNVEAEVAKRMALQGGRVAMACPARIESRRLLSDERLTLRRADGIITMSQRDARVLRWLHRLPAEKMVPIYPVVRAAPLPEAPPRQQSVLLLGSLASPGRREGVEWFLTEMWPRIRASLPNAHVRLVGNAPPSFRRRWHGKGGIEVLGYLPTIDDVLGCSRVVAVPLRVGAGIRVKIIEMMGFGRPVIGTSVAVTGFPASTRACVAVADSAGAFVRATVALLVDDEAWRRAVAGQHREARDRYGPEAAARQFAQVLRIAVRSYSQRHGDR